MWIWSIIGAVDANMPRLLGRQVHSASLDLPLLTRLQSAVHPDFASEYHLPRLPHFVRVPVRLRTVLHARHQRHHRVHGHRMLYRAQEGPERRMAGRD